jgi:toxin ParE1/3/4
MSKSLIIEPEAEADILHAYDWYESQRAGLGIDFSLCLDAGFAAVLNRPKSFPKIHKAARRVLIHRFPYFIIFVEQKDVIVVVAVLHCSREPHIWRRRIK